MIATVSSPAAHLQFSTDCAPSRSLIWDTTMAHTRDCQPMATRISCLKRPVPESPAARGSGKKKSVTFPLDILFKAAVKEHRSSEVAAIVKLLVPVHLAEAAQRAPTIRTSSARQSAAAAAGNASIKTCLEPLSINQVSSEGYSAVMLCARDGHLQAMRLLVAAGADLGKQTAKGVSVFHLVATSGTVEAMRWLLANCGLSYEDMRRAVNSVVCRFMSGHSKPQSVEMFTLLKASLEYLVQQTKTNRLRS